MRKLRQAWRKVQVALSSRRVIFFDEPALFNKMTRLRGWSLIGIRCQDSFPCSHRKATTLTAAPAPDGIPASMLLDGPPGGAAFRAWVGQMPVRELRRGDVVVCDNLSLHRISGIRDLLEATGAELRFLRHCSLDLNPIEKAFLQIRSHLRKVKARKKAKLRRVTAAAINFAKPENVAKY